MKVTVGKNLRPVAIIGVGCTPFRDGTEDNEITNLSEGELFGYAALEAMKDANVDASQLDFFFHGQANPGYTSHYITPAIMMQDWVGMKGKGCAHHSEACCTGYYGLDLAVQLVASGKYNMVLSGCVDMGADLYVAGKPAYMRRKFEMEEFMGTLTMIYDRAYTVPQEAGVVTGFDDPPAEYALKYGLTPENIDDMLNAMSYNNRRAACLNPKAINRDSFDDLAKQAGYKSGMDYLRSPYNPKMSAFLRVSGTETRADGAAAVIVCPLEEAFKYTDKPITVLGTGNASMESMHPHLERLCTEEACREAYEVSGKKPEDIDLMMINDFVITSQVIAAECAGYLPEGEGWKYFIDGRTAFDGDKPINTNGGRTSFGHAHAASGLADVYEAVKQMRGECGARQVKKLPKTTMLRGFGGAQNVLATILETAEKEA